HLPITYDLSHPDELFHAITHDKKARGSQLNIILLEKIGQAKIVPVPTETFKDYLGGL
ncbi:3-dehydroquinate synthase, partial [Enterococcus faecium]|nr:3-dehydroquinate synthase [Enterococcus faecium]